MASRLDIQDMCEIAQLKGGKCLSKEYIDQYSPLKWMCKKGHTWDAQFKIINQGGWCFQCIKEVDRQERLEKVKEIAKKRRGKCLSTEFVHHKIKLSFKCAKGHVWQTRSIRIINGSWCPICKYEIIAKKRTLKIDSIKKIAESRGGKLLSKKYVGSLNPLKWQCSKGHTWMATTASVKFKTWCPYCAQCAPHTIKDMRKTAKAKGGKCLSTKYTNNHTKLKWQCAQGHIWMAKANNILSISWCPLCAFERLRKK